MGIMAGELVIKQKPNTKLTTRMKNALTRIPFPFKRKVPLLADDSEIASALGTIDPKKATHQKLCALLVSNGQPKQLEQRSGNPYQSQGATVIKLTEEQQVSLARASVKSQDLADNRAIRTSLPGSLWILARTAVLGELGAGSMVLLTKLLAPELTLTFAVLIPLIVIAAAPFVVGIRGSMALNQRHADDLEHTRTVLSSPNVSDNAKLILIGDLREANTRKLLPSVTSQPLRVALEQRLEPSNKATLAFRNIWEATTILSREEQVTNVQVVCEQGTLGQVQQLLGSGKVSSIYAISLLEARIENRELPALTAHPEN